MDRRTFLRTVPCAAVALGVTACGTVTAPVEELDTSAPSEYRLGAGDNLRLMVYGEEQLSGEFTVDGGGTLSLPLIGEIKAKDLTIRELETAVAERLAQGYVKNPRVSVEVLSFRPFFIIGEVNKPGQYPYVNGMTAVTAVALAGGFTYRAHQDYILITRGAAKDKKERRAPISTQVFPDDVIRIPERFF